MRAFVRESLGAANSPELKMERLLGGMEKRGLFSLKYATIGTRTAEQTFYEREGNCLSFTILFVALAREAGLRVNYQMVNSPPVWSSVAGTIVVNNHINTVIRDRNGPDYTVDFNQLEYTGPYVRRAVSDDFALALFYNNVGAEALIDEDYERSFAYLRAAVQAYPWVASAWNNIGLLYMRHERYEHAEAAYLQALRADSRDRSTVTNLAGLYETIGEDALAEQYRRDIERHRRKNPYYHFSLAQQAYEEKDPRQALDALDRAIRLNDEEHQFHFLQGLALSDLGQEREAMASFHAARKLASADAVKRLYTEQIEALSRNAPAR